MKVFGFRCCPTNRISLAVADASVEMLYSCRWVCNQGLRVWCAACIFVHFRLDIDLLAPSPPTKWLRWARSWGRGWREGVRWNIQSIKRLGLSFINHKWFMSLSMANSVVQANSSIAPFHCSYEANDLTFDQNYTADQIRNTISVVYGWMLLALVLVDFP